MTEIANAKKLYIEYIGSNFAYNCANKEVSGNGSLTFNKYGLKSDFAWFFCETHPIRPTVPLPQTTPRNPPTPHIFCLEKTPMIKKSKLKPFSDNAISTGSRC